MSQAAGPTAAERDALAVALLATHEALDAYAAAVVAAAEAHVGDPDGAADDPALEAAQDAFLDAHQAFHEASDRVLGIDDEPPAEYERDPEDAVGVELYLTVAGGGEGEPSELVFAESEKVIDALEDAGFEVPYWTARLVPVEHVPEPLDEEEDDDD